MNQGKANDEKGEEFWNDGSESTGWWADGERVGTHTLFSSEGVKSI